MYCRFIDHRSSLFLCLTPLLRSDPLPGNARKLACGEGYTALRYRCELARAAVCPPVTARALVTSPHSRTLAWGACFLYCKGHDYGAELAPGARKGPP